MKNLVHYTLQLADNALIYGHRLSEWCGHAPMLEVDIALGNIALDYIGSARSFYQYAASIENNGRTEDDYPYLRDILEFKNVLLVEQPNGNFADTIARAFFFDTFQYLYYTELQQCIDTQLAAIAEKSIKEVTYHKRFSTDWLLRLGDGTAESHQKIQTAINDLWNYTGELFEPTELETNMVKEIKAPNLHTLFTVWKNEIETILNEATLTIPTNTWNHTGGKLGIHSEQMGFLLAELQYLQKTYPSCEW